jgi:AcrR family transcriptional regulator
VTPTSIYRHFADKQALLVAVVQERWAEIHDLLVGAAAEGTDPFDALRRFCLGYLRFAEERPGHYRVLFSAPAPAGITDDPLEHPGAPTFFALVEIVQRCLDAGAPAERNRDSWFLALQVWLSGHGLVDLRIGRRFPFPWPPAEVLLDAVLHDLKLTKDRAGTTTWAPQSLGDRTGGERVSEGSLASERRATALGNRRHRTPDATKDRRV